MPREPMGPRVVVPKSPPTPYQIVVETLQTHDGTPCSTAWSRYQRQATRPAGSIQVYSTTSLSPSGISALAHKLQADVFGPGGPKNLSNYNDRLDVYGLAMPDSVSEAEIVKRCVAHQRAEIESRDKDEGKERYIQRWDYTRDYRRFIVVIDNEEDKWEDEGMLFVWFDVVDRPREEDDMVPEVFVRRYKGLEHLGSELSTVRLSFNWQTAKEQFGEADEE